MSLSRRSFMKGVAAAILAAQVNIAGRGQDTSGLLVPGEPLADATVEVSNKWHHFAVTRKGTETNLFVDGVKAGEGTYRDGQIHWDKIEIPEDDPEILRTCENLHDTFRSGLDYQPEMSAEHYPPSSQMSEWVYQDPRITSAVREDFKMEMWARPTPIQNTGAIA